MFHILFFKDISTGKVFYIGNKSKSLCDYELINDMLWRVYSDGYYPDKVLGYVLDTTDLSIEPYNLSDLYKIRDTKNITIKGIDIRLNKKKGIRRVTFSSSFPYFIDRICFQRVEQINGSFNQHYLSKLGISSGVRYIYYNNYVYSFTNNLLEFSCVKSIDSIKKYGALCGIIPSDMIVISEFLHYTNNLNIMYNQKCFGEFRSCDSIFEFIWRALGKEGIYTGITYDSDNSILYVDLLDKRVVMTIDRDLIKLIVKAKLMGLTF